MYSDDIDRTNFWVGTAMVAFTVLLAVLHFSFQPSAAEQAERARAREARLHAIAENCAAAKSAQQSLVTQGKQTAAEAVDVEKACEPDKVAARPFLYGVGAYLLGGGLLLTMLLGLAGRRPNSLG